MHVVFHVVEVWVAVDVAFVAASAALTARRRRTAVVHMVDAAERYANHLTPRAHSHAPPASRTPL